MCLPGHVSRTKNGHRSYHVLLIAVALYIVVVNYGSRVNKRSRFTGHKGGNSVCLSSYFNSNEIVCAL